MRVGLVLGAGGIAGAAFHAGTLAALADAGWDAREAEIVVGTSAGSGTGALLRAGLPPADFYAGILGEPLTPAGLAIAEKTGPMRPLPPRPRFPQFQPGLPTPAAPHLLTRAMRAPWRTRPGIALAGLLPAGGVNTDLVGSRIRSLWADRWPDEPMWICTVRLRDGRLVVLGRDRDVRTDVATAVEASSAIPGFFSPVTIDGERHVDGGAHSPTNADLLVGQSLDLVVVSSPMSATSRALRARVMPDGRLLSSRLLAREVAALRRGGTEVLTIQPTREVVQAVGPNAMDPGRRDAVAIAARDSAAAYLASRWPANR